jgi:hypothetical protein
MCFVFAGAVLVAVLAAKGCFDRPADLRIRCFGLWLSRPSAGRVFVSGLGLARRRRMRAASGGRRVDGRGAPVVLGCSRSALDYRNCSSTRDDIGAMSAPLTERMAPDQGERSALRTDGKRRSRTASEIVV